MSTRVRAVAAGITLVLVAALSGCGGNLGDDGSDAAGSYPERAVTLFVGQDAGGSTDLIARALADEVSEDLGKPVTVVNRPGANGGVAAKQLAAAKPDGYTVMIFVGSLAYITPLAVAPEEAVDITQYEVITGISQDDFVLVAHPKTGFTTVKDIQDAKRPIKYATTGVGTGSQLTQALLFAQSKVQATAVPFDGGAPALAAVLGGQVDVASIQLGEAQPQIKAGKLTPLVTFAAKRPAYLPDSPTAVEAGFNVPVQQSRAIVAPDGTPQEVIDRLRNAFAKAFESEKYQAFNAERLLTPNEVEGPTLLEQWTKARETYRGLVEQYKIDLGGE
ncbi:tripartite tricarboxylate transporter substrate binding protein [Cryptosporangium aurantiacum]|uniref:Tripartite-type tricarboxylate transporter, receptor component TctC n=1 Tax=Cryptosporangium aurantiacum TaxID=134849 RepID=A0A1M7Q4E5_9ACTN|nr:tripartite tricarboxylate transporter substrate binding protein [Cryptosporangium aurantiacum]SHN25078.1 Tripartite-type tricarboxylate transporter, receptor component TctC [Cryptosporangium aurantiacum]